MGKLWIIGFIFAIISLPVLVCLPIYIATSTPTETRYALVEFTVVGFKKPPRYYVDLETDGGVWKYYNQYVADEFEGWEEIKIGDRFQTLWREDTFIDSKLHEPVIQTLPRLKDDLELLVKQKREQRMQRYNGIR